MTLSLPDSFFRDAVNPMWVFDDQTLDILDVNESACLRYGYFREEFLAMSLLDLRTPEEQELFKHRMDFPGRAWEHRTKAGEVLYVQGHEFQFVSEGRRVVLAMIVDVTERVKLEQEKSELLQRYQVLSEAANDLLWDWNLKTNEVTHNEALITQYGYSRDDLVRPITWWSDKIHPDDFSIAAWSIQEAIRERRRYWTAEYRFKKADGSYVLVLDRGILHADENETPLRMVGSIVDLTTRKAAEDDRNQLFRLSVDSMLFLDPAGAITQANAAFYNVVGQHPDASSKQNMREFLSPEDRAVFDRAVNSALVDGTEGHFSTSIATDASKGKTIQWGLITNEARNRLFLVGRDVTESIAARDDLETALARSQEFALEAQAARQAQTEFLQNMSHELRTPMNGMLGTAQLLAATAKEEKQSMLASILVRSGELLLQILNDILDFSKIESGKITLEQTPFLLPEAVQTVYDLFALSANQKDITFTMDMSPEAEVTVIGDPFRLRQVLSNLIGNAIKFTDDGAIAIYLDAVSNGDNCIEAIFKIRDTGIGVPTEMQPRIFDRFVQVDSSPTRRHGGTGLGLSISQTIVELMGGSITLESKLGKGSDFVVRIPYPVVKKPTALLSSGVEKSFCSKIGTKVLIAEDVEVNAMILTSWLEERGFECVTVATGTAAIEALSSYAYDGAFVDLHMPEASGYDVVAALRASEHGAAKHLPMVAVTASVSQDERQKCAAQGFDDFIPKPILVAELDRVVARLF